MAWPLLTRWALLDQDRVEEAETVYRLHRRGWGSDRRRARNLERNARALRGAGREDEARRLETRAGYLRAAIEKERAETAESRERVTDKSGEPPGAIFEGEEEWPLATPVFIFK